MKKLLAMLLALSLLLSVSAVFAEGESADAADTDTATVDAAPEEPVLLVTLNGEEIYSDNAYLNYVVSYYLDYLTPQLSLSQNIDMLFFRENGPLRYEYDQLFASLFKNDVSNEQPETLARTRNEEAATDNILTYVFFIICLHIINCFYNLNCFSKLFLLNLISLKLFLNLFFLI